MYVEQQKTLGLKVINIASKWCYHSILQVHSIFGTMPSHLVTAPTSFICCKAKLDTSILSFMCLHSMYIIKVVTNSEIVTVTNRKNTYSESVEKGIFVGKFLRSYGMHMPFFQIKKIPFYCNIGEQSLLVSWVLLVNQLQI